MLHITIASLLLSGWMFFVIIKWGLISKSKESFILYMGCVAPFFYFFVYFTFFKYTGFFVYKLVMWFSFIVTVAYVVGLYATWRTLNSRVVVYKKIILIALTLVVSTIILAGNIYTTTYYVIASLGTGTDSRVLVRNFSGNYDYLELSENLRKYVKPQETIGTVFINSIQQEWVSYYLRYFRLSILNQHRFIRGTHR